MLGRPSRFPWGCLVAVAGLFGACPGILPCASAVAAELEEVVVTAPGTVRDDVDGATVLRRLSDAALADATDVADALDRHFAGIVITEAQGNRAQKDVQFRGFVGSHLLGLPQGIALYQDGVRINEPFGDTINWVLVPLAAMQNVGIVSGSPLFGLNALGGAVVAETKSGLDEHPTNIRYSAGSFDFVGMSGSFANKIGTNRGIFGAMEFEEDDGWRDFSESAISKAFLRGDWVLPRGSLDASVTAVDADLAGNGAAPGTLLETRREAIFTHPDLTLHEMLFVNARLRFNLTDNDTLTARLYGRISDIETNNGDDSDFEPCDDAPHWMCFGDDGDGDDDGGAMFVLDAEGERIVAEEDVIGATFNRSQTEQETFGFSLDARHSRRWIWRHELVWGVSRDQGSATFAADTQLGSLDGTRRAIAASGVFVGDAFTQLVTETTTTSLYFSDAIRLGKAWLVQIGGRFDDTRLELHDQIGTALDGDHDFRRLNPMLALRYHFADDIEASLRYAETNRTPSPVELTCADPDDPCRLPNGFLADPPLDDVVTETREITLRGMGNVAWHATAYQITNQDDILFISAGPLTNQGYFGNVGTTRRNGVELAASGGERLQWFVSYAYLDATFDDPLQLTSPNHPLSEDGEISVRPGDRLPLLPEHVATAGVRHAVHDRLELGAHLKTRSGIHYRGDESNQLEPIDGFATLGLSARLRLNQAWLVDVAIDNATDEQYATFGLFGEADEVLGDDFDDPYFVTPGTPRSFRLAFKGTF